MRIMRREKRAKQNGFEEKHSKKNSK